MGISCVRLSHGLPLAQARTLAMLSYFRLEGPAGGPKAMKVTVEDWGLIKECQ